MENHIHFWRGNEQGKGNVGEMKGPKKCTRVYHFANDQLVFLYHFLKEIIYIFGELQ